MTRLVTFDIGRFRIGLSICYDLRFPELYRGLVDRGANVLLVPAAFTAHTGKDHWHPLLRARAIESQAFVVAAAQWGKHPLRTHDLRSLAGGRSMGHDRGRGFRQSGRDRRHFGVRLSRTSARVRAVLGPSQAVSFALQVPLGDLGPRPCGSRSM